MTDAPNMEGLATIPRTQSQLPAVRLRRGSRTIYQLALAVDDFEQIVPGAPQGIAVGSSSAQRGYIESHARKIARFMLDNPDTWAFGPISLVLESKYMTFERFQGLTVQSVEYGVLSLHSGALSQMKILDGQHRRAALQLIRAGQVPRVSDDQFAAVSESIYKSDLSVDLYEIDEETDVRRVFNWMNTTKSLTGAERVLLDNTDPFNAAVQRLTGSLPGRFESDRIAWLAALCIPLMNNEFRRVPQTIRARSTFWLSATNLRHILLARVGGRKRLSQADRNRLTPARIVQGAKKLFNDELPQLRPEWQMLRTAEVSALQIPDMRETTLAFDPMIALTAAWSLQMSNGSDDLGGLATIWQSVDLGVDNPTKLLVLNNRDEPVRPTMDSRFAQTSAQNMLNAARDA